MPRKRKGGAGPFTSSAAVVPLVVAGEPPVERRPAPQTRPRPGRSLRGPRFGDELVPYADRPAKG